MARLVYLFLMASFTCVGALGFAKAAPKPHLLIHPTEQAARMSCPNDQVVWVSTTTHTLYLPRDRHYAHTHGGYACEAQARALGYHGPTTHV